MKRHFWFMFFIILELVYVGGLFFGYDTVWLLFAANVAVLMLLLIEPYWKIGATLIYLLTVEVFIQILNEKTLRLFLLPSRLLTALTLLLGLIVVVIAYNKRPPIGYHEYRPRPKPRKIEEHRPEPPEEKVEIPIEEKVEETVEETFEFDEKDEVEEDIDDNEESSNEIEPEEEEEDIDDEANFEEQVVEEKPNISDKKLPEPRSFIATGETIHTYDCWLAAKAKESRIVTEVYAKAQKMKECKRCKPFSN